MNRILIALIIILNSSFAFAAKVTIKDGWFYVKGEKFFVSGIGYELGCRRGELPWSREFEPDTIKKDLALIKKAGFNTLRTWSPYKENELEIMRDEGFMVIQGFWLDPKQYHENRGYSIKVDQDIENMIRYSKKFDNILFYTIMNEPHPDVILEMGVDEFTEICDRIKSIVNKHDPGRYVTFSHASWNEFLGQSMWDIVFFNDYMYAPNTVNHSLKYQGHISWLKQLYAKDKPFVVGEFGLAVSKNGPGKYGYGGNTLEEQKDGSLDMYESLIAGGAQGGCLFMWTDGWWKSGDENFHNDNPEEWFGVLGADEASEERNGLRPVYYGFKEYNHQIVIEPKRYSSYDNKIPIEVYSPLKVKKAEYCLGNGNWKPLKKQGKYRWIGEVESGSFKEGIMTLEVRTKNKETFDYLTKKIPFIVSHSKKEPVLKITTDKESYKSGDVINYQITLSGKSGNPIPEREIYFAFRNHFDGNEKNYTFHTDAEGKVYGTIPVYSVTTYLTLSIGADLTFEGHTIRYTDAKIIMVRNDLDTDTSKYADTKGNLLFDFEYKSNKNANEDFSRILTGDAKYEFSHDKKIKHSGNSSLKIEYTPLQPTSWGYAENKFEGFKDLGAKNAVSFWIFGDASCHNLKIMLVDKDGERWHGGNISIDWRGWKKTVMSLSALRRDPHDGNSLEPGNNNLPDFDKIKGLALAIEARGRKTSTIYIDQMEAY